MDQFGIGSPRMSGTIAVAKSFLSKGTTEAIKPHKNCRPAEWVREAILPASSFQPKCLEFMTDVAYLDVVLTFPSRSCASQVIGTHLKKQHGANSKLDKIGA